MVAACIVCNRDKVDGKRVELVTVDMVKVRLCAECQGNRFAYQRAVEIVRGMK